MTVKINELQHNLSIEEKKNRQTKMEVKGELEDIKGDLHLQMKKQTYEHQY